MAITYGKDSSDAHSFNDDDFYLPYNKVPWTMYDVHAPRPQYGDTGGADYGHPDTDKAEGEFLGIKDGWMIFGGGIGKWWNGGDGGGADRRFWTILKIKWNDSGTNCQWKCLTTDSSHSSPNGHLYLALGQYEENQFTNLRGLWSTTGSGTASVAGLDTTGHYFEDTAQNMITDANTQTDVESTKIKRGESFNLIVYGSAELGGGLYWSPKVTFTVPAYEGNFVNIYSSEAWHKYRPWIYNGTTWQKAKPFIYNNGWKQCR